MDDQPKTEFFHELPEPSSWSQDRRLKFIDFRLRWEGRVNRSDLMSYFHISAPQATADFAKYSAAAGDNVSYDGKLKAYVRMDTFSPVYARSNSQLYLNELLAVATNILDKKVSFIGWQPEIGVAPLPSRTFTGDTLTALLQSIREKRTLTVFYQGMNRTEPVERELSPHALAFDGMRWHARAYCHLRGKYQDFVLGRMLRVTLGPPRTVELPDVEWDRTLTLVLAPNPSLSVAAKRAIRLEYGMNDGVLQLSCRHALLFYALRRLRLEHEGVEDATSQQLTLVNRDELKPFI
jgi:hypothetical protein